jgi:hypothetical protein
MTENPPLGSLSRRKVLKTTGCTAAAMSSMSLASATPTDGPKELVGVSYHPYTHEKQDAATASIQRTESGLEGTLNVAGFTIPVDTGTPVRGDESSQRVYNGVAQNSKVVRNGLPLEYRIKDYGHGVVGHVTRPGNDHGKLSFTMNTKESGATVDALSQGLKTHREGSPNSGDRPLPKLGIPGKIHPEEV